MAKQIILVTGGARSGKSRYAEQRSTELGSRRLYVATAEAKDEEMAQRIAEHKKRRGDEWITIEGSDGIVRGALAQRGRTDCALVDCIDHLAEQSSAPARYKICGGESRRIGEDTAAAGFSSRSWSPTRSAGASCRTMHWRGNFVTSPAGQINESRRSPTR